MRPGGFEEPASSEKERGWNWTSRVTLEVSRTAERKETKAPREEDGEGREGKEEGGTKRQ